MGWSRQFPILIRPTQGDTIFFRITLLTDKSGDPITSIDGWTIRFSLKLTADAPESEKLTGSKSSTDGGIMISGTSGIWKITKEESAALPAAQEILFDVQVTDADGDSNTVRKGRLILDPQITQTTP